MQKDDATWLRTALSVWACLTAFVFWKLFIVIGLQAGWIERFDAKFQIASIIAAIVCGIAATYMLAVNAERHDYFLASVGELRKVHWPDWDTTKKLTIIVCVVVGIMSALLTMFDMAWAKILKAILA